MVEGAHDNQFSSPKKFLGFLAELPSVADVHLNLGNGAHSEAYLTPACTDWWVSLSIAHLSAVSPWRIFQRVHLAAFSLDLFKPWAEFTLSFICSALGIVASQHVSFSAVPFCVV
jgi:hypothetical protein